MEERDLELQFKKFDSKPSKKWQETTLLKLNKHVTDSINNRNSNTNLNYLNSITMNTKFKAITMIVTVFTTLAVLVGVAYASDSAKAGELLFPVDKAMEQIRRTITLNPLDKAGYEMDLMDERILELREMSEGENSQGISKAISEVEAQKERVRNMLEEMTKLRAQNRVQAEEQLEVMNKLAAKIQDNEEIFTETKARLEEKSGEATQAGELDRVRVSYSEDMGNQISNFEESTGLKVNTNTAEQNQGEDSQIRNEVQNEIQNGEESEVHGVQVMNKGESKGN